MTAAARDLVLLHGWAMTRRVWDAVIPGLEAAFRVHNLALPGYDDVDPAADRYPAMSGREILDQWSDNLSAGVPPGALWIGWSLGALVVMNALRRAPARVRGAVLVSATPRFIRAGDWDAGVEPDVMRGFYEGMRTNDDRTLRRFVLLQADDRSAIRTLSGCVAGGDVDKRALEAGLRVLEEVDLRAELPDINAPVRVVHGAGDRIVPPAAGAHLAERLPNAGLVTLDAGHAPFVECPRAFTEAVLAWA